MANLNCDLETSQILDQMTRTAEICENHNENRTVAGRQTPEINEDELHKLIIPEFPPPTYSTPTQNQLYHQNQFLIRRVRESFGKRI